MKKIRDERKMFHRRSTNLYLRNKKLKKENQELAAKLETIKCLTKEKIKELKKTMNYNLETKI